MLGMWEILGHSSPIPLLQRFSRIWQSRISNFCNGVVWRKFGTDFNFGHFQILKRWRCGVTVNLTQSSSPPIPFHSSHSSNLEKKRDIKFGNSVIIISSFSFFADSSIHINSTPTFFNLFIYSIDRECADPQWGQLCSKLGKV